MSYGWAFVVAFVGFLPFHRHPDTAHKVAVPARSCTGKYLKGQTRLGWLDVVHC